MLLDSHNSSFRLSNEEFFYSIDNGLNAVRMESNDLCFSQMAGMDRSTMGTAMETDDSGNTVRRSTRERVQ